MNNKLIFLRHAETKKDRNVPVSKWHLTEDGVKRAQEVADGGVFDGVDIIISSTEKKAVDTAKPIADRLGLEISQVDGLTEIDRDKGGLLSKEEYEEMKVRIFQDLNFSDHGWESAGHALERYKKAVREIDEKYEGKKILIVSHGSVMTLFFSDLQNDFDDIFQRWQNLDFCAWGVIENGKVTKDLI